MVTNGNGLTNNGLTNGVSQTAMVSQTVTVGNGLTNGAGIGIF